MLVDSLRTNHTLRRLDLSGNRVGDVVVIRTLSEDESALLVRLLAQAEREVKTLEEGKKGAAASGTVSVAQARAIGIDAANAATGKPGRLAASGGLTKSEVYAAAMISGLLRMGSGPLARLMPRLVPELVAGFLGDRSQQTHPAERYRPENMSVAVWDAGYEQGMRDLVRSQVRVLLEYETITATRRLAPGRGAARAGSRASRWARCVACLA